MRKACEVTMMLLGGEYMVDCVPLLTLLPALIGCKGWGGGGDREVGRHCLPTSRNNREYRETNID